MKVNIKMVFLMVLASNTIILEISLKESIEMEGSRDLEDIYSRTVVDMKANLEKGKDKGKEFILR